MAKSRCSKICFLIIGIKVSWSCLLLEHVSRWSCLLFMYKAPKIYRSTITWTLLHFRRPNFISLISTILPCPPIRPSVLGIVTIVACTPPYDKNRYPRSIRTKHEPYLSFELHYERFHIQIHGKSRSYDW